MSAQKVPPDVRRVARSGARLAAVQALYQLEHTDQSAKAVIRDFMEDRLGLGPDGMPIEEADPDLFKAIVHGVVERQGEIDRAIAARLASGWRLERLDATTRAILRAAVFELIGHPHLTAPTILDEYVSLAHAFFEDPEPKFVNGVLDRLAKELRDAGDPPGAKADPFAGV